MDRILFKGKLKSDNSWTVGYYTDEKTHEAEFPCIIPLKELDNEWDWAVVPETICQKINSVEWYWEDDNKDYVEQVWTGDIVKIYFGKGEYHICYLDIEYGDLILVGDTLPDGFVWVNELNSVHNQNWITDIVEDVDHIRSIRAELLGNRFDNPELLEGNNK